MTFTLSPTSKDATRKRKPVSPSNTHLHPVNLADVRIDGGYWKNRQDINRDSTIPHALGWMERLGWLNNFDAIAQQSETDQHRGRQFADSEVYKLLEAMAWDQERVGAGATDELAETIDQLIEKIGGAQDSDGYLHTMFGHAEQESRYSDFVWGHEQYCFGHLFQSAVARARTSSDPKYLEIAKKLADHVSDQFGPEGDAQVCGHAEIEMGLVELWRVTGDKTYLDQAKRFVDLRGTGTLPLIEFGRSYYQDDIPVRDAEVLRGHSVRALYLTAGAVDVAIETGDMELLAATEKQWENTVARRTYITGGMGSHHMDEGYGEDFVLPPDRAYCEICAGVAAFMLGWRLLLATGKVQYADFMERVLYNIIDTGPAADGTSFFYANPLHVPSLTTPPMSEDGVAIRGGSSTRQPWFDVSCCPPNVARTFASLSAYVLTTTDKDVQIGQFMDFEADVPLGSTNNRVELKVETNYPETGNVTVTVEEATTPDWSLTLRVPVWATAATLEVGGETQEVGPGWVDVPGPLRAGDQVVLSIPLVANWVTPDPRIDAVRGTVAVQRGPEVYCLESVDLPQNVELSEVRAVTSEAPQDSDGQITIPYTVESTWEPTPWPYRSADTVPSEEPSPVVGRVALVPYRTWANRGPATMRIWIPTA